MYSFPAKIFNLVDEFARNMVLVWISPFVASPDYVLSFLALDNDCHEMGDAVAPLRVLRLGVVVSLIFRILVPI
jgi:hypothetical protein